jgi:hypothetical protein
MMGISDLKMSAHMELGAQAARRHLLQVFLRRHKMHAWGQGVKQLATMVD